jgi:hypothetical protein
VNHHPAIAAAMDAVHDACRKGMMGDIARAAVRVEIGYGVEDELRRRMHRDLSFGARHAMRPMTILGVSFYTERSLPDQAWRVIAPFEHMREYDFIASCDKSLSHDAVASGQEPQKS